ncbi:MAG: ATP-binding protein [Bacteroidia bacterium]
MKNLKSYACFLRDTKLLPFTRDSIAMARAMDMPLMSLFANFPEEELVRQSLESNTRFFTSLEDGTMMDQARESFQNWEENKLPGIGRHDLTPADLILAYAVRRRMMQQYLTEYTSSVLEAVLIMRELEDYFTAVQVDAMKILFRIQKELESELESKTRELIRSNSELEQFAYVASHDLQEPLRMITSYIQLLANRYTDKLDADANDFIHFAVDGSNRMRVLINCLLEYSRINRIKPFEPVKADTLIETVMTDLSEAIAETGTTIQYNDLPVIFCDAVLIGLLFQNLISNAIRFRGPAPPVIQITCVQKGDHYLFCVKDNGIGIQKEYFNKIFIIFQRLNSMDKYPGTGIGLAICKKIVDRHKGEIWVESEPGKGASFYFTLST